MSLFQSWLSGGASPRHRQRDADGPVHRTDASRRQLNSTILIPPPISSSRQRQHAPSAVVPIAKDASTQVLSLEAQEAELQARLQLLLDAQADGLLHGLGQPAESRQETAAEDMSAAFRSAAGRGKAVPVRQPRELHITLKSSRRGLTSTMGDLSRLRATECDHTKAEIEDLEGELRRMTDWDEQRKQLQSEITSLHNSQQGSRAEQLKLERSAIQEQINDTEMQLSRLKSEHQAISIELSNLESSVQSKLSSFQGSLALLEKDIDHFLKAKGSRGTYQVPDGNIYGALPSNRRNLDIAFEHVGRQRDAARARLQRADTERTALEEGSAVWANVVQRVTAFETFLRAQLHRMTRSTGGRHHQVDDADTTIGPRDVLARLDSTVKQVEADLEIADSRNWKLLVVAISAELEALRQGRLLLTDTFEETVSPAETRSESHSPSGLTTPDEVDPTQLGIERIEAGTPPPNHPESLPDERLVDAT